MTNLLFLGGKKEIKGRLFRKIEKINHIKDAALCGTIKRARDLCHDYLLKRTISGDAVK